MKVIVFIDDNDGGQLVKADTSPSGEVIMEKSSQYFHTPEINTGVPDPYDAAIPTFNHNEAWEADYPAKSRGTRLKTSLRI